ncbi:MAG: ABC transporter ATP-binding protein [Oscillospiraceae bacterium]
MAAKSDKQTLKWIFASSKGQLSKLVLLIVGNGVYAASSIVFALMCKGIVDGAVAHSRPQLIRSAIGLGAVILCQLILRLVCNSVEELATSRLEMSMRSQTLKTLFAKDYSHTSKFHSGELLNRMFSDIQIVAQGVTGIVPSFVNMVTRLVCAVAVLIVLDKSFTLLFVAAGLCLFAVSRFFRRKLKALHKDVQSKEGKVRSFLQETVSNLLIVKVFGTEKKMLCKNDENQQIHFKARMKRRTVSIFANAGFGFVFQLGYLYAMLWGARGIYTGAMTYGTLTAILQLVNQIQTPFANLSSLLPKFYSMTASAERLINLEELPDEPAAQKRLDYSKLERISIKDLDFSYGENHVLTHVDIDICKGDFTALTGISGGGKSTLFLLLLGAYQPQKGCVRFIASDGEYSPGRETRSLFAYVPQGNFLFSGTVAENIGFLNENASQEEIISAAETACALDFIKSLPDGFNTKIGENGFGISEGQAQRIAIARALLSEAPILLLDEATSALDEATEAQLLKNIEKLSGKTLLIVTHRPAALDICGKRLILKDGRLTYENIHRRA